MQFAGRANERLFLCRLHKNQGSFLCKTEKIISSFYTKTKGKFWAFYLLTNAARCGTIKRGSIFFQKPAASAGAAGRVHNYAICPGLADAKVASLHEAKLATFDKEGLKMNFEEQCPPRDLHPALLISLYLCGLNGRGFRPVP